MEDSMYPNPDEGQTTADKSPPESESAGDEKSMAETALLPKSLLAGSDCKAGDKIILKIVHEYGDEIEVAYVSKEEGAGEPEEPEEESMAGAQGKLDAMATEA